MLNAGTAMTGGAVRPVATVRKQDLEHALRAARENETAMQGRLHRVRDAKGMELLRALRVKIASLEEQLRAARG